MSNKKTSEETTRSPIDGSELVRLATATPAANFKTTVAGLFDWFKSQDITFGGAVAFAGAVTFGAGVIATSSISGLAAVATSGAYADLSGKPSLGTLSALNTGDLAAVAYSGAYADLSGKPSLAAVATSGAYADLSGKPSLATVAISGAYADLSGKPSLAAIATSGSAADLGIGTLPAARVDLTAAYAFSGLGAVVISQQGASASALTLTGGTVTTSQPLINATQTWNASGVAFTALKLNVTQTASADNSLLADFQVGGVSRARLFAGVPSTQATKFEVINQINNASDGLDDRGIIGYEYSDSDHSSHIRASKARGTLASPATIITGDWTGSFSTRAWNGSAWIDTGSLAVISTLVSSGVITTKQRFTISNAGVYQTIMEMTAAGITAPVGASFAGNGLFGGATAVSISAATFEVQGNGAAANTLSLMDTQTQAANIGGSVAFGGRYNTAGDYARFARIASRKTNATSGNSLAYLDFLVNTNASASGLTSMMTLGNDFLKTTSSLLVGSFTSQSVVTSTTEIQGNAVASNTLSLLDTQGANADSGGSVAFGGIYTSGGAYARFGRLSARKLNGTSGNSEAYFSISVNTNASASGITESFRVTKSGIKLLDGVTAPSALSGWAEIYIDTADGDLKVIFGDGTIKTIVVDT